MISAARFAAIFALLLAGFAVLPGLPALESGARADSAPDSVEITFWNSIQGSKDPADFQAYLDKYPSGYFADLAKNRLRKLTPAAANPPAALQPAPQPAPQSAPAPQLTPTPAAPQSAAPQSAAPQSAAPQSGVPVVEFSSLEQKLYARANARLRVQPSRNAAVLSRVAANTVLAATGRSSDGDWWRIALADGGTGYLARSAASPAPVAVTVAPAAKKTASVPAGAPPSGNDAEDCKPASPQAPNDRVLACERLANAAGLSDTARRDALGNLAVALDTAHRYDEAIRKYEQAATFDPNNAEPYSRIGLVRMEQARYPEARAAFEKAARLDPKNPDIVYRRGLAVAGLGDFDAARRDVKRALLTKDDPRYYDALGGIELARGDITAAKTAVERGLKADPNLHGLNVLAVDYFAGSFDLALGQAALLAGEKDSQDAARIALWRALALKAKGDAPGADRALEAGAGALGREWPAPVFDFLRGKISEDKLRLAGKSGDAREQAERLCEIDFYAGEAAFLAGNSDAARKNLLDAADTRIFYYLEYAAAKARLTALAR